MPNITPKVVTWQQELKELKHAYLQATAPGFYAASGGRMMKLANYTDKTTNGLTAAIFDFLKFKGHYCNRINTTGIMRKIGGRMKYTPSTTRKGTADLHCVIFSRHVSIEIKCAATKDRIRPDQEKERQRIESAGGIFFVARDMASFIEWYNQMKGGCHE